MVVVEVNPCTIDAVDKIAKSRDRTKVFDLSLLFRLRPTRLAIDEFDRRLAFSSAGNILQKPDLQQMILMLCPVNVRFT